MSDAAKNPLEKFQESPEKKDLPESPAQQRADVALSVREKESKSAVETGKEQAQAKKEIAERELASMKYISDGIDSFDELSESERDKILSDLKSRLSLVFAALLASKSLDFKNLSAPEFLKKIKELGKLENESGLKDQEKYAVTLLKKILDKPADSKLLEKWQTKYWPEVLADSKATCIAASSALNVFTGCKNEPPKNLTEKEKSIWEKAGKFVNKHPVWSVLIAGAGVYAACSLMSKTYDWAKGKSSEKDNLENSEKKEGFLGKLWKRTKQALFIVGGIFTAGHLLDKENPIGVLGRYLEKHDIHVDKNRLSKALIYFSRFEFIQAVMILLHGVDEKEKLHADSAKALGEGVSPSILWLLGKKNFNKFNAYYEGAKEPKEMPFSAGIFNKIPGLGWLINSSISKEEFAAYTKIKAQLDIIRDKNFIKPEMTIDEVLGKLFIELPKGHPSTPGMKENLTPEEQKRAKANMDKEISEPERKAYVVIQKIDRKEEISREELDNLAQESEKLKKDIDELKTTVSTRWDVVREMGMKAGFGDWLILKKWFGQELSGEEGVREKGDILQAQKELKEFLQTPEGKQYVADFLGKAVEDLKESDLDLLNQASEDIGKYQKFLEKMKSGEKLDENSRLEFRNLHAKIFGDGTGKGWLHLIRGQVSVTRANNARYQDMKKDYNTKWFENGSPNLKEMGNDSADLGKFFVALNQYAFSEESTRAQMGGVIAGDIVALGAVGTLISAPFIIAKKIRHPFKTGKEAAKGMAKIPRIGKALTYDPTALFYRARYLHQQGGMGIKDSFSFANKMRRAGISLRELKKSLHPNELSLRAKLAERLDKTPGVGQEARKILFKTAEKAAKLAPSSTEIPAAVSSVAEAVNPAVISQLEKIRNIAANPAGLDLSEKIVKDYVALAGKGDSVEELTRKIIDKWNIADKTDHFKNPEQIAKAKAYAEHVLKITEGMKNISKIPADQWWFITRMKDSAKIEKALAKYVGAEKFTNINRAAEAIKNGAKSPLELAEHIKEGASIKVGGVTFLFKAGIVFAFVGTAFEVIQTMQLLEKAREYEKSNPELSKTYLTEAKYNGFVAILTGTTATTGLAAWVTGSALLAGSSMTIGALLAPTIPISIAVEEICKTRKFSQMNTDNWLKDFEGKHNQLYHEWLSTNEAWVSAGEAWDSVFTSNSLKKMEKEKANTRAEIVKALVMSQMQDGTIEEIEAAFKIVWTQTRETQGKIVSERDGRKLIKDAVDFVMISRLVKQNFQNINETLGNLPGIHKIAAPKFKQLVEAMKFPNGLTDFVDKMRPKELNIMLRAFDSAFNATATKEDLEKQTEAEVSQAKNLTEYVMYKVAKYFGYSGKIDLVKLRKEFFTEENKDAYAIYWNEKKGQWYVNEVGLELDDAVSGNGDKAVLEDLAKKFKEQPDDRFGRRDNIFSDLRIQSDPTFVIQSREIITVIEDAIKNFERYRS